MTPDELFEDEQYFRPRFDPDKAAANERKQAKRELNAPAKAPLNRQKALLRIVNDPAESYSKRQDAQRLLQLADIRPNDFQREYDDFLSWNSETQCTEQ